MPQSRNAAWIFPLMVLSFLGSLFSQATAQEIPHNQDRPPGPALSPQEAIARMKVPPGFVVELVAAEPQVVNPTAMCFDAQGRIWVCESLEYPRRSAGPGRDRIKVLEDTDGDGRVDRVRVFAEGLNIPSAIAVGYGGVWVANSPDILFLQDTDGDGRADRREVVVTGFGRHDTHELPNSFTWGPDGWLYGLNGVFNPSRIKQGDREYRFTCAMFRIHPRTRRFELFAEGTSNPWGIAFDPLGNAFVSACVIDHLWHIAQRGYYVRQAGAYPPFTWRIGSIVNHRHQKAAYCGLHFLESDVYPEPFNRLLYMGNIHGNCINVDRLHRRGSTYHATAEPDFLVANDAWFMPVDQKTGPDGCLYILDWYDRYHCYQDANRDPKGIDRLRGRIYRVRYKNAPRRVGFDLERLSSQELMRYLEGPNDYFYWTALRILQQRDDPSVREQLRRWVLDCKRPLAVRLRAFWALIGTGHVDWEFLLQVLALEESALRAWGVRAAGNLVPVPDPVARRVVQLAQDPQPDVLLQVVVAAEKMEQIPLVPTLVQVLNHCGSDSLVPQILWQVLHPHLEQHAGEFAQLAVEHRLWRTEGFRRMWPYLLQRLLARPVQHQALGTLLRALHEHRQESAVSGMIVPAVEQVARASQSGELSPQEVAQLQRELLPLLRRWMKESSGRLRTGSLLLAATWDDPQGTEAAQALVLSADAADEDRAAAFEALVSTGEPQVIKLAQTVLEQKKSPRELKARVLQALGQLDRPEVALLVLNLYRELEPSLQAQAVQLLVQRRRWTMKLLEAIGSGRIPPAALSATMAQSIVARGDPELVKLLRKHWGTVRTQRDPRRQLVVDQMRYFIRRHPGDPRRGEKVFAKLCGQCHKLFGQGQEVGPDLTANGRNSFDQLLSNVFDPSLVIGSAYQARTVVTDQGRVLTGLVVEDSPRRVVLKLQGGKLAVIPRERIEAMQLSRLSMMPEDVEKQLSPQEIADLFAYLVLDRPPQDPQARRLPGVYEVQPQQTNDPSRFNRLLAEVAPGWECLGSGFRGVALLAQFRGRRIVVRTHPLAQHRPCVLRRKCDLRKARTARLRIGVSCLPKCDWLLVIHAQGRELARFPVSDETVKNGWLDVEVDLSQFAGKQVVVKLENRALGRWWGEFGFWHHVELITEPPQDIISRAALLKQQSSSPELGQGKTSPSAVSPQPASVRSR